MYVHTHCSSWVLYSTSVSFKDMSMQESDVKTEKQNRHEGVVGEAETRCNPLCTLDAAKVSDYTPEGECQLPKNPGHRLDICRCFVSPQ